MKNIRLALLASLALGACAGSPPARGPAAAYSPADLSRLWNDVSDKQRKLVTSNSVHFWAWAKNEAGGLAGDYLGPVGVVIGDPHPRNVFDYRAGPRRRAELAVADIDDGGRAPLFLDMVRYITYLKATSLDLKIAKVFEAYVAGLDGARWDDPALLNEARAKSLGDLVADHEKYLAKKAPGNRFGSSLGLTPIRSLPDGKRAEEAALEKEVLRRTGYAKLWDTGFRVNDSGSSAGMARYWFLVGSEKGAERLFEAKELSRAAVDYYQEQLNAEHRVAEVVKAYSDDGLDPQLFAVVKAQKSYWLRPRKFQVLDLADDELGKKEAREFAVYMAYWMGRHQASQPAGPALRRLVDANPDAAKEACKRMVRAYLDEVDRLHE